MLDPVVLAELGEVAAELRAVVRSDSGGTAKRVEPLCEVVDDAGGVSLPQ